MEVTSKPDKSEGGFGVVNMLGSVLYICWVNLHLINEEAKTQEF